MISVHKVADYFLAQMSDESGDTISPLKLQKLVYYAQGFHLACNDKAPLFPEAIEAWDHGPVAPVLYRRFREVGGGGIPKPEEVNFDDYSEGQRALLDQVYEIFGQFSAWKLANMTHEEPPWKNTPKGDVISHDALYDYFKTQVEDE